MGYNIRPVSSMVRSIHSCRTEALGEKLGFEGRILHVCWMWMGVSESERASPSTGSHQGEMEETATCGPSWLSLVQPPASLSGKHSPPPPSSASSERGDTRKAPAGHRFCTFPEQGRREGMRRLGNDESCATRWHFPKTPACLQHWAVVL